MKRYHKDRELASRDVVARAIWSEMQATKARHVYLDITHLSASFIKKRFPTIYATCLRYDIDITEEWIPVSPSAHYWMGGVHTDLHGRHDITWPFCGWGSCLQRRPWRQPFGEQLPVRGPSVRTSIGSSRCLVCFKFTRSSPFPSRISELAQITWETPTRCRKTAQLCSSINVGPKLV